MSHDIVADALNMIRNANRARENSVKIRRISKVLRPAIQNQMKPQVIALGLSGLVGSRISELLAEKYELVSLTTSSGVDITKPALVEKVNSSSVKARKKKYIEAVTPRAKIEYMRPSKA